MTTLTAPTAPSLFDLLEAKIEDYERRGAVDIDDLADNLTVGDTLRGDVLHYGATLGDYTEYRNAALTITRGHLTLHPANLNLPSRRIERGVALLIAS